MLILSYNPLGRGKDANPRTFSFVLGDYFIGSATALFLDVSVLVNSQSLVQRCCRARWNSRGNIFIVPIIIFISEASRELVECIYLCGRTFGGCIFSIGNYPAVCTQGVVKDPQIGGRKMLLSDLAGKEIINLHDGAKLGLVGDADLAISPSGSIEAIILGSRGLSSFWSGNSERETLVIPWQAVKKVGSEVIIVDLFNKSDRIRKYSV